MMSKKIKIVLLLISCLFLLTGNSKDVMAECALVLTSPADGAVFTGTSGNVTIYGYVKAEVDPGYGYIELTNNNQFVQRWEGTFTSANYVLQSGAAALTLSEGENHIVVEGDAVGCSGKASDEITVYYEPDAEVGPDAELGNNPEKGDGSPRCQNHAGDPINIATGNVNVLTTDFRSTIPGIHRSLHLQFVRSYNSQTSYSGPLGYGWSHNYNLAVIPADPGGLVGVRRPSGQVLYFKDTGNGTFSAPKGVHNQLALVGQQYLFTTTEDVTYTFNDQGRLLTITDLHGNSLTMQYNSADFPEKLTGVIDDFGRSIQFEYGYNSGLLTKMTDSGGREYLYKHDITNKRNLIEVTYPSDGELEKIEYEYTDPADEHNLTKIIDENGHGYIYSYDDNDHAVLSASQDNANRIDINNSGGDTIEVTNSLDYKTIYSRTILDGIGYITGIAPAVENGGSCSTCGKPGNYEYDIDHTLKSITDARGITTSYTYDTRGNTLTITEALATDQQRLTEYIPHAVFNKPERITVKSVDTPLQNKITEIDYDPNTGATLSVSVKGYANGQYETRTTTFTEYTPHGQIKQINGPRTDVTDITNFEYYPDNDPNIFNRGMLYKVINALNQTIEFGNYNSFGRPGQVKDSNNIITLLEYDARGRLTGKTVNGKETVYSYDKVGNLHTITPPGLKNIVTFTYTNANLLEYVYDQLGNYLKFSYDTEGNLKQEQNYTSDSVLKRYLDYEYNEFNRLNKIINPDTTFILLETDNNGNLSKFSDAMNRVTHLDYDNLDRMTTSTAPGAVISSFEYDSHDNTSQITDPGNTATEYSHDDFGGLHTVVSQDTGVMSYDYDTAGNLKSKIDANQVTEKYDYDILNRLSTISYTPVDISQNIFFEYDEPQALHGIGRLTSTSDVTGSTSYQYDAYGFVTQETRILDSVTYNTLYSYNDRNNLEILTYPTGLQVTYLRHDNEQISGILVDGQTLTQNVSYMPFGPEEDFVFGSNVLTVDRKYFDNYFRLETLNAQVLTYQYQYFADDKVKSIEGEADPVIPIDQTGYVKTAGTNLLDYITNPDQSVSDYTYDNNGNTTSDGVYTYAYNLRNRLVEVKQSSEILAEYLYDPFGRRIKKTVSGTVTHFHYDQQGRLLSETTGSGAALRDYVYQNDNLVALKLYGAQAGIYYVINDHLGTPQQIVNSTGSVVWKAAYLPFGKAQILVETITNNICFKGQYFDAETGLHYNWHRYYKPSTGRYLTPDPIGLAGGLNLFSYTENDPVNWVDPDGLIRMSQHYSRNRNNHTPSKSEAVFKKWNGDVPARYHQQGYGNEGNQKYVSPDGHHEVVYDTAGSIVTDPANMGTYNFASPTGDPLGHLWDDMIPYYLWGNSPDDPTPFLNRLFGPKDSCDPGNSTIAP